MPVAIAGMHRSGTSLVAHMLRVAGLNLGAAEDLVPESPDNPDGYWEHIGFQRVNDAVLAELGGGWERPPLVPARWREEPRLEPLEREARALLRGFRRREPWGWKDPRTSVTVGLWLDLVPNLRVVICLRNPLEVALSLHRRGMFSYTTSLALWREYNARLLDVVPAEQRLVTHYDAWFTRPKSELRRLLGFLGMDAPPDALEQACALPKPALRHSRFSPRELLDAEVAPDIVELYAWLRTQAGPSRQTRARAATPPRPAAEPGPLLDERALDAEQLRRTLRSCEAELDEAWSLCAAAEERAATAEQLAAAAERRELGILRERDGVVSAVEELQSHLYDLEAEWISTREGADGEYGTLVRKIREIVRKEVPRDTSIVVVSKGDDSLLHLYGRRGVHFPQTEDGVASGYYPACSLSAIAHLETLRARGAQYLLVPATALWWLEHYPGLKQHVVSRYRSVVWNDVCALVSLRERPDGAAALRNDLLDLVGELRSCLGREPAILDWNTGLDLRAALPAHQVFSPPNASKKLLYLDGTVDIVALAGSDRAALADAERVASAAVIVFPPDRRNGAHAEVRLKLGEGRSWPSVSIVVPCHDGVRHTAACLATLRETLPRRLDAEIVVVDDASSDGTAELVERLAGEDERITVIRNPKNLGFLRSANRGAEEARGEVLVFLNNDTILLPDWLPPLLDLLRDRPDAGAVGGRLVYPDGTLQEAGAIVFADGSAAKIGYRDPNPEAPAYGTVRVVDYCSGCLLATPRALFLELGGFDRRFEPGFYEDTDYCFRLSEAGKRVYYEPASTIVHVEGATAGMDLRQGPKRFQALNEAKFARKWKHALERQPERPEILDAEALLSLVARG